MRDSNAWWVTFVMTFAICCAAPLTAQTNDDETVEELKQRIEELRSQIENQPSSRGNQSIQSNERVRDVGRQIVRRKPQGFDDRDIDFQIRLYDLSDLFAVSPNYPATVPDVLQASGRLFQNPGGSAVRSGGGGFGAGAGGGGVFSIPSPNPLCAAAAQDATNLNMESAQVTLTQLVDTLKETVKPEMWGSSNTSARIKFLGNTLLITATEEMHQQINNLLNLFREHWGKRRTVSIQTWWIRADHGSSYKLNDKETTEKFGAGVVSKERWEEFFNKAKEEKRIAYAATLTGHNNQTLHALSGKQVRLTIGADPFESKDMQWHVKELEDLESTADPFEDDGEPHTDNFGLVGNQQKVVGFRPVETTFHEGATIEVTPLATRGGNFVILDLRAKINELLRGERGKTIFVENEGKRLEVKLDDTDCVACRFNSTLRCPKDEVVLAGSMTWDPVDENESPEIHVFVRASVHTIEEDQSDWKKTTLVAPAKPEDKPAE